MFYGTSAFAATPYERALEPRVVRGTDQSEILRIPYGTEYSYGLMYGYGGHDFLSGGTKHDNIWGHSGDDQIWGGYGNDRLFGGPGDDWISAGGGTDRLYGGAGADRFVFGDYSEEVSLRTADLIGDFNRHEGDKIDISDYNVDASDIKIDTFVGDLHGKQALISMVFIADRSVLLVGCEGMTFGVTTEDFMF